MVTVSHSYNADERHIRLSIQGHANYAERGKDIICSAVSILLHTVVEYIEAMDRMWYFTKPPNISLVPGDAVIEVICRDDETFVEALRVILFALTGCKVLSEGYPQYVRLMES